LQKNNKKKNKNLQKRKKF